MSGPDIILYHYPASPYARRITWYLALTQTPYTQCIQPPLLPRPDLSAVGVSYRRIPVLSIDRDIYCDTRAILRALGPHARAPLKQSTDPTLAALTKLLSAYTINQMFPRASQLIPPEAPLLKDERFLRDREQMSGRSWKKDDVVRNRPEALVHIREGFELLENLLADGRQWVEDGEGPGMGDIEAVWPFHWLISMPGALPAPVVSASQFPRVFAYVARFDKAVKEARAKAPKPASVKGDEATKRILGARFGVQTAVDSSDPLGLTQGETVQVFPIDSGFSHQDNGRLVGLDCEEVVIEKAAPSGETVRLHFPRISFRVKRVEAAKL